MILLAALLGCHDEADEWRCVGPLVEVVRWRDGVESERILRGVVVPPAALAAEERRRVLEAVETLRPERNACRMTWNVLLFHPPENPGLRLREEAIGLLLGQPPHDYPPEAVGSAGVTVAGRPPVAP